MSKWTTFLLEPRDPVIARDGRPFGFGQGRRMRSLDWLYPSTATGSLRTMLGRHHGMTFNNSEVKKLKDISCVGPFLVVDDKIFFPAPMDLMAVVDDNENQADFALRPIPLQAGEGCDLPIHGLQPIGITDEHKPKKTPDLWSSETVFEWLASSTGAVSWKLPDRDSLDARFQNYPEKELRIHTEIGENGAAKDERLFMTEGIDMHSKSGKTPMSILLQVYDPSHTLLSDEMIDTLSQLGGERRLVHWRQQPKTIFPAIWTLPKEIYEQLKNRDSIRMVLLTPAIFEFGWRPKWVNEKTLEGIVPETDVKVKLISAIIPRWNPISGWSLESETRGEKAVRRLVPAGSVFFFQVVEPKEGGATTIAESKWLKGICDRDEDNRDGFGVAAWGVWDY